MCNEGHSSWLYRGLVNQDAADASDVSSQEMFVTTSSFLLQAPSKQVVSQLSTSSHGQQLLQIVSALGSQLLAQSILCPSTAAARGMSEGLQELHSCIVALDDLIDEQRISSGVATQLDECRQWLKHTQNFILQVQKQVHSFAEEQHPSVSSMDTSASLDEASCSTSNAPNSAASLNAWRTMCQEASDALGAVAAAMAAGGSEEGQAAGKRTRLVAQSSRLSYATHWAKKVAI